MNLGLTGGMATGKSTVADMLVRRGAILIDADQIAREIVQPKSDVLQQIKERFGNNVILQDGSMNRKLLSELIFANPVAREDLEAILHPLIRRRMWERQVMAETLHPEILVVVDVPLLYESNLQNNFQEVMVVYVPENIQVERLISRNHLSRDEAMLRIQAQMPIEQKKLLADIVIDNQGSLSDTESQIERFWTRKE